MKTLSISKNHLRKIRYEVIAASMYEGINEHPQTQMRNLGINLIKAIPESIADCWICLTDYSGKLPSYIDELPIKPHDAYWQNWDIDLVE